MGATPAATSGFRWGVPMSRFLTMEEAAERLGVEYKTVYRLVRTGDLPAGKVGRIYRIREDDLLAYFDRQKNLMVEQARRTGLAALDGRRCAACEKPLLSELSVGGLCETCSASICQGCWSVRKIRQCPSHAPTPGTPDDTSEAKAPRASAGGLAGTNIAETIAELRRQGRTVTSTDEALLGATNFLRAFGQRIETIEELPDPLNKRPLVMRQARVKHFVEPPARKGPPAFTQASRFVMKSGGWGRPKAGLVLEARYLAHDRALAEQGYDAEPFGEPELTPILAGLRENAKQDDAFWVLLLGSPTGWSGDVVRLVTQRAHAKAFHDKHAAVALHDLARDEVQLDFDDERLKEFWPLLAPERYAEALQRTVDGVRELATRISAVAVDYAVKRLSVPPAWVRAAFTALVHTGTHVVSELPELGRVLSRK